LNVIIIVVIIVVVMVTNRVSDLMREAAAIETV
jgi:hypothetical protein